MIRRARRILPALLLLAASGCNLPRLLFGEPRPSLESYRLMVPPAPDTTTLPRSGPLPGGMAIAPYIARGIYDRPNIAFRIDDVRLETYPSRTWAIPLRDMLGDATETMLERRPLTAQPAVFDPRSPRSYEYQWRGTVVEFEEVNRGRQVLAAVHLEAELVRSANDSVVWSGAERIERPVPQPTDSMSRVVETLGAITAEALTRLIERARTAATVPTAAAAPPPE